MLPSARINFLPLIKIPALLPKTLDFVERELVRRRWKREERESDRATERWDEGRGARFRWLSEESPFRYGWEEMKFEVDLRFRILDLGFWIWALGLITYWKYLTKNQFQAQPGSDRSARPEAGFLRLKDSY